MELILDTVRPTIVNDVVKGIGRTLYGMEFQTSRMELSYASFLLWDQWYPISIGLIIYANVCLAEEWWTMMV